MGLDFVDVNDFLSYKNIDLHDDVSPAFNQNVADHDLFLKHNDSLDRLFEYSHTRDFRENLNTKPIESQHKNSNSARNSPLSQYSSKIYDEDLRYGSTRLFPEHPDGMAYSKFPDAFDS
jgi:hypothetical protein